MRNGASSSGRVIVLVGPRFHTNQVGLVKALQAQGHFVEFHGLLRGQTEDYSVLCPVIIPESRISKRLRRIFGERGVNRPWAFPNPFAYYRRLNRLRPDVLIARDPSRAFSLVAASCARLLGARVVFYSQDPLHRRYSSARRVATSLLLSLFSASWYTPLQGAVGGNKPPRGCYFIPFAVEGRDGTPQERTRATVLMVGKYDPRKNHLLLVEAIAPIMTERDVDAVIVGECTTPDQLRLRDSVEGRIKELGLEDRFTLLHDVPFSEMPALYQSADLFVLPSSSEPAAISILEAIASGVPAVCSDSCGTRDYIEAGVTGDVFSSNSVEDLQRVLREWLSDAGRLQGSGLACRQRAASFSGPAFYLHFKEMVEDRWPAEAGRW